MFLMSPLFTIGHSNHTLERFLDLLAAHNIQTLVDVRTFPSSRYSPHFNQPALRDGLAARQIGYLYAGAELGGRRREPYDAIRQLPAFREAVRALIVQSQTVPTAIMCAEEDPFTCHRRFLIARSLVSDFAFPHILHIRKDSSLTAEPGFPDAGLQLSLFG